MAARSLPCRASKNDNNQPLTCANRPSVWMSEQFRPSPLSLETRWLGRNEVQQFLQFLWGCLGPGAPQHPQGFPPAALRHRVKRPIVKTTSAAFERAARSPGCAASQACS
jgi:hypothetical protein